MVLPQVALPFTGRRQRVHIASGTIFVVVAIAAAVVFEALFRELTQTFSVFVLLKKPQDSARFYAALFRRCG